jgi:hypothetical protein
MYQCIYGLLLWKRELIEADYRGLVVDCAVYDAADALHVYADEEFHDIVCVLLGI